MTPVRWTGGYNLPPGPHRFLQPTHCSKGNYGMKITDIKAFKLRAVRDVGELEPAWSPGRATLFQVGGGSYVEIHTDEGITGYGECSDGRNPYGVVATAKEFEVILKGRDPRAVEARSTSASGHLDAIHPDEACGRVDVVHHHGLDAHVAAGALHPQRDLAPVGDEDLAEHQTSPRPRLDSKVMSDEASMPEARSANSAGLVA